MNIESSSAWHTSWHAPTKEDAYKHIPGTSTVAMFKIPMLNLRDSVSPEQSRQVNAFLCQITRHPPIRFSSLATLPLGVRFFAICMHDRHVCPASDELHRVIGCKGTENS